MTKSQYINRKIWPWLLAAACLLALTYCEEPQAPVPEFSEWTWADCLPSASGTQCPGDKPSWQHYIRTGKIVWRYQVSGLRTIYTDRHGHIWRIYEVVDCLDYQGTKVGRHTNMGFRAYQFGFDPITGQLPECDDIGPISGQVYVLHGAIGPQGQVAPVLW